MKSKCRYLLVFALWLGLMTAVGCRGSPIEKKRFEGIATLLDRVDHSGTKVTVVETGDQTVTSGDGAFRLDVSNPGPCTLSLTNGDYEEIVPGVFQSGDITQILEDPPAPLPPFELPRGHRVLSIDPERILAVSSDGSSTIVSTDFIPAPDTYSLPQMTLLRVPLQGGDPIVLGTFVNVLQWSPDRSTLFFSDTNFRLYSVAVDQGETSVIADGTRADWLLFSPNKKTVLVPTTATPGSTICGWKLESMPITGGSLKTLSASACYRIDRWALDNIPIYFSPHGEYVVFATTSGSTFSVAIDGTTSNELGGAVEILSIVFSSDDRWMSYRTIEPGPMRLRTLHVARFDGSQQISIATGVTSEQFSPTGTHLSYLNDSNGTNTLHVVKSDGSQDVVLASGVSGHLIFFSPDGSKVFFFTDLDLTAGTGTLWAGTVLGDVVNLGANTDALFYSLQLSPDGSMLAFDTEFECTTLMGTIRLYSIRDGSITTIGRGPSWYKFSPDNTKVWTFSSVNTSLCGGTLIMFEIATAASTWIANDVGSNRLFFAPGSERLFFFSNFDCGYFTGTLQSVATDGTSSRTIATGVFGDVRFSPKGTNLLYYTNVDANSGTWTLQSAQVNDGNGHVLAKGVYAGDILTFSTDGSKVLGYAPDYQRQVWFLFAGSLDSAEPVPTYDPVLPSGASFSPDGMRVSFFSGTRTQMITSTNGEAFAYLGLSTDSSWTSPTTMVSLRTDTSYPLGFQNGVYLIKLD